MKKLRRKLNKRPLKDQPENLRLQRTTKRQPSPAEIAIEISLPTQKLAETVYTSLIPETRQPPGYRSRTVVRRKDKVVQLNIKAADIVALRAASNSFLRFVSVAMKTLNIVTPFYIAEESESPNTTGEIV